MAPIIALALVVAVCVAIYRKEIARFDVKPLAVILLGIAIVILASNNGKTVHLGTALWSSYWLPQMLAIIILFLLAVIPGPRLSALLKAEKSSGYQTIASTVIGILICVLVGMIAVVATSHQSAIPLLLNR